MSGIGKEIARWLNLYPVSSEARERVRLLLVAMQTLEATLTEHPIAKVPEVGPTTFFPDSPGTPLLESINKTLADYVFTQALWVSSSRTTKVALIPNHSRSGEATIVHLVCELHKEGKVSSLRVCTCGKWFMARSHNQECCVAACRQKRYDKTEKGKAAGKKASSDAYGRVRSVDIKRTQTQIKEWELKPVAYRKSREWKVWVASAATVTQAFITRAVNKGEIVAPA